MSAVMDPPPQTAQLLVGATVRNEVGDVLVSVPKVQKALKALGLSFFDTPMPIHDKVTTLWFKAFPPQLPATIGEIFDMARKAQAELKAMPLVTEVTAQPVMAAGHEADKGVIDIGLGFPADVRWASWAEMDLFPT